MSLSRDHSSSNSDMLGEANLVGRVIVRDRARVLGPSCLGALSRKPQLLLLSVTWVSILCTPVAPSDTVYIGQTGNAHMLVP